MGVFVSTRLVLFGYVLTNSHGYDSSKSSIARNSHCKKVPFEWHDLLFNVFSLIIIYLFIYLFKYMTLKKNYPGYKRRNSEMDMAKELIENT